MVVAISVCPMAGVTLITGLRWCHQAAQSNPPFVTDEWEVLGTNCPVPHQLTSPPRPLHCCFHLCGSWFLLFNGSVTIFNLMFKLSSFARGTPSAKFCVPLLCTFHPVNVCLLSGMKRCSRLILTFCAPVLE